MPVEMEKVKKEMVRACYFIKCYGYLHCFISTPRFLCFQESHVAMLLFLGFPESLMTLSHIILKHEKKNVCGILTHHLSIFLSRYWSIFLHLIDTLFPI